MANDDKPIQPRGSQKPSSSTGFLSKLKLMQFKKKKSKGPDYPFDVTSSKGFFQELLARTTCFLFLISTVSIVDFYGDFVTLFKFTTGYAI